ncbi:MAG TPA: XdhC family protein [Spongiibacteraceae bacterium]|jgi:xanthine dehydrogenase accessory factor
MDAMQLLETALKLQREQQPFAWVTVLHAQAPASARPGDKALVLADGSLHGWIGGGCAQPAVLKTVRAALSDGVPRTIRIAPANTTEERAIDDVLEFGMACHSGGVLELFIDPILPAARLIIFGDSPVAHTLVALASRVGFNPIVVAKDARATDFADAKRVLDVDDAQAVKQTLGSSDWIVVATQGRRDVAALKAALALQPKVLWFVASARKAAVLKESLIADGEDAAQVAAIIAPAGQILGAHTPEEIALSVLATVVAQRRQAPVLAVMQNIVQASVATNTTFVTNAMAAPVTNATAATNTADIAMSPAVTIPKKSSCCGD